MKLLVHVEVTVKGTRVPCSRPPPLTLWLERLIRAAERVLPSARVTPPQHASRFPSASTLSSLGLAASVLTINHTNGQRQGCPGSLSALKVKCLLLRGVTVTSRDFENVASAANNSFQGAFWHSSPTRLREVVSSADLGSQKESRNGDRLCGTYTFLASLSFAAFSSAIAFI